MKPETPISKEKVTMKKLLDGKIQYKGNFNTIDDKTRNQLGNQSFPIKMDQMETINAHQQFQTSGVMGAGNTDYHALASSSYMSPAQLNKTRGFVDFDL